MSRRRSAGRLLQRDPGDALLWGTPYRTVKRLGGADASETLLAEELDSGQRVHVKILRLPGDGADETTDNRRSRGERVRLEADTLRQLRHPNAVEVLDAGCTPDGRPYFVTEPLAEGAETLAAHLAGAGALSLASPIEVATVDRESEVGLATGSDG